MGMLWQSTTSYPTLGFAPRGPGGAGSTPYVQDADASTDLLWGARFLQFLCLYGGGEACWEALTRRRNEPKETLWSTWLLRAGEGLGQPGIPGELWLASPVLCVNPGHMGRFPHNLGSSQGMLGGLVSPLSEGADSSRSTAGLTCRKGTPLANFSVTP